MQALTMVAHIKHNTVEKYNYCLATGDAMLCNSFIFMCSIAKVSPNLWMPISKQQTSLVYGNMLNNFNPNSNIKSAPTEVRNANKVRRTPNRSNGNRSNGNRSTGTRSIVSGVSSSGGSTVGGNNNNNEIRSPNSGRTILNQRLRAKGLNNANRIALLKNYNKGMNVNNVINKANTIVSIKKKAENKKNLNQRLRAKGLNNANRIALLNNYNKGTMNVNKVITKANAIVLNKKRAENKKNLNKRLRDKGLNNNTRIALLNKYNKGTLNVNGVIAKANQIINNNKRSNPAEMNLGAAIMSGEGMKRQRNNTENNRNAVIANLQAQLARAQAALVESTQAANAAARNARNARNASNAQAAKNAANEAIAKVKRQERALKQLQTNASLAGVSPNQGLRKSKRQK